MEFIGRENEQKVIQNILSKESYQGCILYGRRRLGKTELVKHCLANKGVPFIIYQCKESTEEDNTRLLEKLIEQEFGLSYLSFPSFMDAVSFLFEYGTKKEVYFVLDEYPYLRNVIDGCDSKLQEIIDKYAMHSRIKFFLLGSSIASMESVLQQDNPLYMRFTNSILLRQMDYYDSAKFYPSFSEEDKVRLYAAFGGVPFYNAQIDERLSIKENIIRVLSGQFSGLKDFLETYLKGELRKINNANVVFETIALGAFHFKDILDKSRLESSALLANTLQKLIKMDLVEYIAPINDLNNKKKAGYRISDFCVRFYYNYIYRNESAHRIFDDSVFYDRFIKDDFESRFVPYTFETVSRQYLIRKNRKGELNPVLLDIGTYWYDNPKEKKNGQFDVVGRCEEGYVFYECKFLKEPIKDIQIEEEVKEVMETSLKPIQIGFISRSGFSLKKRYPYEFITIEEVYR